MERKLILYNTLTRRKEEFRPINSGFVGMYVCGPTVYGEPHLGHARSAIVFDVLYRILKFLGYKVRYVRNITDVGHLEIEVGEGEDKIEKVAKLQQLEPMEIAQRYTNLYHFFMDQMNVERPSIEPRATGHIIEQIEWIKKIIDNGFAYVVNSSVYFDLENFLKKHDYGILSGRKVEDLYENVRNLPNLGEKKNFYDFALWKKASATRIMKWPSPWGEGFPGWHLECSVMSSKYLGEVFDIHGGGIDLIFPHHECEIAQSLAYSNKMPVKYWIHNNLVTINGQKMSKSLNNFITLEEIFTGNTKLLSKSFHPQVVRFFILQAHYRSVIDFSNDALLSAEKAFFKLMNSFSLINKLKFEDKIESIIEQYYYKCLDDLCDDMNTSLCIATLFDVSKIINTHFYNSIPLTINDKIFLEKIFNDIIVNCLGLKPIEKNYDRNELFEKLLQILIEERSLAKEKKDYETSDRIRQKLQNIGIFLKDYKDRTEWEIK